VTAIKAAIRGVLSIVFLLWRRDFHFGDS